MLWGSTPGPLEAVDQGFFPAVVPVDRFHLAGGSLQQAK
jgi:hypothetical protein